MTAKPHVGLPAQVRACLFDLDGVLTRTAEVHLAAWTELFDAFLSTRSPHQPPFTVADYQEFVDGRPRLDGIRAFLAAREIVLPDGLDDDPPWSATVHGLARRKQEIVLRQIGETGVQVYEGSVAYVRAARAAGLATAVVSSSANTRSVLQAGGMAELFEVRVDAEVAQRLHLAGKPAADTFLTAARLLGVGPEQAAVFEDALVGVQAGRTGDFALVVGVDRFPPSLSGGDSAHGLALREHGADVVVHDLSELLEV